MPTALSFPSHPLRFVAAGNPLFLLSGVSMLLGCYLINSAVHEEQLRGGGLGMGLGTLATLLAVFNLYEFLVIGLGVYLLRSRGLVRDAAVLLLLEVLLLVDTALVYNEIATQSLEVGAAVAVGLAILAAAKVGLIAWGLKLRMPAAAWALVAADLLAVLAVPLVPRAFAANGQWELLPDSVFLWMWWIAGALIAAHAIPRRWTLTNGGNGVAKLRRAMAAALVVAPIVSVLGHLRGAHYIYEHAFYACYLSPVLLGAAAVVLRRCTVPVKAQAWIAAAGLAAVVLSLGFPHALAGHLGFVEVTPMRLTLVATAALWFATGWVHLAWWFFTAGAAALAIAATGARPSTIGDRVGWTFEQVRATFAWVGSLFRGAANAGQQAVPSTSMGWGILAVAAAFVLLAGGGCVSLLRRSVGRS